MSKESTNKKELPQGPLKNSRRTFFKNSVLGIGGATLAASALSSCDTDDETRKKMDMDGDGMPDSMTKCDPNGKNGIPCEWGSPREVNFARMKDLPGNPLRSGGNAIANFLQLDVDKNKTNVTTGQSEVLFAYNGTVPGPTIRIDGSQDLYVVLTNSLGGNNGEYALSSNSRIVKGDKGLAPGTKDWQIAHHLYGPHQQHTTNLHTHGLHVSPGVDTQSQEKTQYDLHSDNVLLRVIPFEDYEKRVTEGNGPELLDNEQIGQALYRFKLTRPNGEPHYPGTHWYHPHPHGATYDQVASGMAGFFIVEGPPDRYLREQYRKNDYKELPLLIQRIFAPPPNATAEDAPAAKVNAAKGLGKKVKHAFPMVNGKPLAPPDNTATATGKTDKPIFTLPTEEVRPNQVIRLRVLNGSVDGQGYVRLFLVKSKKGDNSAGPAQLMPKDKIYKGNSVKGDPTNASAMAKRWFDSEDHGNNMVMTNIAFDGIHLQDREGYYTNMPVEWLSIGVANRADFLVTIPADATENDEFTIWAQDMVEAVDGQNLGTEPSNLAVGRLLVTKSDKPALPTPAHLYGGVLKPDWVYNGEKLKANSILKPVTEEDITIKSNREKTDAYLPANPTTLDGRSFKWGAANNQDMIRTRRLVYSGFGHASVLNSVNYDTAENGQYAGRNSLYNAMLIDGKKYGSDTPASHGWDAAQHKMQVNTAEEWTVYNYSMTTLDFSGESADIKKEISNKYPEQYYENADTDKFYLYGVPAYEYQELLDAAAAKQQKEKKAGKKNPPLDASLVTKAVHHPFHIHQNPFFVRSLQDANGRELLPLDDEGNPIPRWQDTIYIPHNGGRVIFRARFMDYTGKFVNHCHLLQHEDWGMMQAISIVDGSGQTTDGEIQTPNYIPAPREVTRKQNLFPPLRLVDMFKLDLGKLETVYGRENTDTRMLCFKYPAKQPEGAGKQEMAQHDQARKEAKADETLYFDQDNLTSLNVGTNVGTLKIPLPGKAVSVRWNNDIKDS